MSRRKGEREATVTRKGGDGTKTPKMTKIDGIAVQGKNRHASLGAHRDKYGKR